MVLERPVPWMPLGEGRASVELSSSQPCTHGVGVPCHPSSCGSRPLRQLLETQNFHTVDDRVFLDGFSTSLGAPRVKNMPAVRETWVQSLCREDPSEKEMATLSSILAWRIPGTEEPGGLQCTGSARSRHDSKQGAGEGTNGPCCLAEKIRQE